MQLKYLNFRANIEVGNNPIPARFHLAESEESLSVGGLFKYLPHGIIIKRIFELVNSKNQIFEFFTFEEAVSMFFDVLSDLCKERHVTPTRVGLEIGVSSGTISYWRKQCKRGIDVNPDSNIVARLADYFGVSVDYLLGRTSDPVDYSNPDLIAEMSGPVLDHFDGDVKKATELQQAVQADVQAEELKTVNYTPKILTLYQQLDDMDKARAEAYISGMLEADKYKFIAKEA